MTPEQFAYWLQGFAELNTAPPTAEQWKSINEHLQTVFKKVTPQVFGPARALGEGRLNHLVDAIAHAPGQYPSSANNTGAFC